MTTYQQPNKSGRAGSRKPEPILNREKGADHFTDRSEVVYAIDSDLGAAPPPAET